MSLSIRAAAILMCYSWIGYSDDACPKATVGESGNTPELSWTSGTGQAAGNRTCIRQQIANPKAEIPLAVVWPAAGMISAEIGGQFVTSFCCFEGFATEKSTLRYGVPSRSLETRVNTGSWDDDDDFPDLIEDDAKNRRSSFFGKLWDGSKFVEVDLEFRAAASYPHFNQSVFQFVIVDRSPQRLTIEWNLLANMSKTMQPYYTGTPERGHRQDIYVFFAKMRPSAASGIVEVKTADGKLLARFSADGFKPQE